MKKIKLESVFNEFTLMGIAVSGAFYLGAVSYTHLTLPTKA